MKYIFFTFFLTLSICSLAQQTISFTFDDGSIVDQGNLKLEEWNGMILKSLEDAGVTATFFVTTQGKQSEKGKMVLNSWDKAGHSIANHTHTHPSFNNPNVSALGFEKELLRADKIIQNYTGYKRLFRFPYLKEGNNTEKADSIRQILDKHNYQNGYVTIDASDWYVDSRLKSRIKEDPKADLEGFKEFYLEHLYERALYYDKLGYELTGRHIKHTLLLHHNLAAALFLDDLIAMFKERGWNVISSDEAYKDPIFKSTPSFAGESLLWALAKDSGKYEESLRYPAEDSRYEKANMDKRGL